MPVNYRTPSALDLYPVDGVRLGVAEAGIRKALCCRWLRGLALLACLPPTAFAPPLCMFAASTWRSATTSGHW